MTCSAMPCCFFVTPACASANVSISPSIACALRSRSVGHPCAARQAQDRTLGSRGFLGLSTGPTPTILSLPRSAARRWRLLARPVTKEALVRQLRDYLHQVCHSVGLSTRIVPHQFRHTYASEMLRSGVGFPAVMKLLGHTSPQMTMRYLDVALSDLQREFDLARSKPRHLVPQPKIAYRFAPSRPRRCDRCLALRSTCPGNVPSCVAQRRFTHAASTDSPTASPRSSPKRANSTLPENGQRLAGYGEQSRT